MQQNILKRFSQETDHTYAALSRLLKNLLKIFRDDVVIPKFKFHILNQKPGGKSDGMQ